MCSDYLFERPDTAGGHEPLSVDTVIRKFDEYLTKRNPQLMVRKKFWLHLKHDPTLSFDSWVMKIRDQATEYIFPSEFLEQVIRDKTSFSRSDYCSKLKLRDEGATLSVKIAIEILFFREATTRELCRSARAAQVNQVDVNNANASPSPLNFSLPIPTHMLI